MKTWRWAFRHNNYEHNLLYMYRRISYAFRFFSCYRISCSACLHKGLAAHALSTWEPMATFLAAMLHGVIVVLTWHFVSTFTRIWENLMKTYSCTHLTRICTEVSTLIRITPRRNWSDHIISCLCLRLCQTYIFTLSRTDNHAYNYMQDSQPRGWRFESRPAKIDSLFYISKAELTNFFKATYKICSWWW